MQCFILYIVISGNYFEPSRGTIIWKQIFFKGKMCLIINRTTQKSPVFLFHEILHYPEDKLFSWLWMIKVMILIGIIPSVTQKISN